MCVCTLSYSRIRYNAALHPPCAGRERGERERMYVFTKFAYTYILLVPKRNCAPDSGHTIHHAYIYIYDVKLVILNGIGYIISFCRTLRHNFSVNMACINRPTVCLSHKHRRAVYSCTKEEGNIEKTETEKVVLPLFDIIFL